MTRGGRKRETGDVQRPAVVKLAEVIPEVVDEPRAAAGSSSQGRPARKPPHSRIIPAPKTGALFQRTRLCRFFQRGMCSRGESCMFAHGAEFLREQPDLRCTKLCPAMLASGICEESDCRFAHSQAELRQYNPHAPGASGEAPFVSPASKEISKQDKAPASHISQPTYLPFGAGASKGIVTDALNPAAVEDSTCAERAGVKSHQKRAQRDSKIENKKFQSAPPPATDDGGDVFEVSIKRTFLHFAEMSDSGSSPTMRRNSSWSCSPTDGLAFSL